MKLFIQYIALLTVFLLSSGISTAQEREQQSLRKVIDTDGRIMPGTNGSFDASGYKMTYGKNGEPVFSPTEFDGGGPWSALGSGTNSWVNAIAVSGNDVYAGGNFTTADGNPAKHIAKWDGASWSALDSGINGVVYTIAVSGNDVYAGGNFTTAGGDSANHIAKWDGASWSALGAGVDDPVSAIVVIGNDLYAGGSFDTAGGSPANYIARWDGASWSALGSGVDHEVRDIAVIGNDLYAGGKFDTAGGNPANRIAKWDGTSWSALGSGVNKLVVKMAVIGNDLYAGGKFTTAGGSPVNYIARWDGTSWSALGSGVNHWVYELSVIGNDLYAGGIFTTAGGDSAKRIAKWDGANWSALGSGFNGSVNGMTTSESDLYVGGWFSTADGNPANNIAKWMLPPPAPDSLISNIPQIGSIQLNWIDNSSNEEGFVIEKSVNSPSNWSVWDTVNANSILYLDTGLTMGNTYYYRVYAHNIAGNSDYSNVVSSLITGIIHLESIPEKYSLHQNYPNPFNPATSIKFSLPESGFVNLKIYDVLGKEIAVLVNEDLNAGVYEYNFNAASLPSGVYFYSISSTSAEGGGAGNFHAIKKMLLIK